jgi:hypothetical protein
VIHAGRLAPASTGAIRPNPSFWATNPACSRGAELCLEFAAVTLP